MTDPPWDSNFKHPSMDYSLRAARSKPSGTTQPLPVYSVVVPRAPWSKVHRIGQLRAQTEVVKPPPLPAVPGEPRSKWGFDPQELVIILPDGGEVPMDFEEYCRWSGEPRERYMTGAEEREMRAKEARQAAIEATLPF